MSKSPASGAVVREALSERTMLLPRDVLEKMQAAASFQREAADLFSFSGLPLAEGERVVVCGGGDPCALVAVPESVSAAEFTTPLLAPRSVEGESIYAMRRGALLYIKVWGRDESVDWDGLRFAEAMAVESSEQVLFYLARLGQMYEIEDAPVCYHGSKADVKLLRRYFEHRLHATVIS